MAKQRIDIFIVNDPKMERQEYADLTHILNDAQIDVIKKTLPKEFERLKKKFMED